MVEQTEKAFLKQPRVFLSSKKSGKGKRPGKGGKRSWKNVALGFKTPQEAIEVERGIAVIQAIREAEIENLLSRVRLVRSYFSKEQLETPILNFFKENLPNISVIRNEKYKTYELKWNDRDSSLPGNDGRNVRASLDNAAASQAVGGLHISVESVTKNFLEAANLHITDFVSDELSAYQTLGVNSAFRTPGETGTRLSFGMTPKTVRLPKNGEMLLSVRGSPLGVYKDDNLEAIHESGDGSPDAAS